jgi:hypothetical protein
LRKLLAEKSLRNWQIQKINDWLITADVKSPEQGKHGEVQNLNPECDRQDR